MNLKSEVCRRRWTRASFPRPALGSNPRPRLGHTLPAGFRQPRQAQTRAAAGRLRPKPVILGSRRELRRGRVFSEATAPKPKTPPASMDASSPREAHVGPPVSLRDPPLKLSSSHRDSPHARSLRERLRLSSPPFCLQPFPRTVKAGRPSKRHRFSGRTHPPGHKKEEKRTLPQFSA